MSARATGMVLRKAHKQSTPLGWWVPVPQPPCDTSASGTTWKGDAAAAALNINRSSACTSTGRSARLAGAMKKKKVQPRWWGGEAMRRAGGGGGGGEHAGGGGGEAPGPVSEVGKGMRCGGLGGDGGGASSDWEGRAMRRGERGGDGAPGGRRVGAGRGAREGASRSARASPAVQKS